MSALPPIYRPQRKFYSTSAEVFNAKKAEEYASGVYSTDEIAVPGFKGLLEVAAESRKTKTESQESPIDALKKNFKNFLEYISFKNLRKDEKIDDDACRTDEADTAAAAEKE